MHKRLAIFWSKKRSSSLLLQVRAWQKSEEGQAALAKKRKTMGRAIKLLAKPPALITSSPDLGSQQLFSPADPGPAAGMQSPAANAAVSAFMGSSSSKWNLAPNKQPSSPLPPQAGPTADD